MEYGILGVQNVEFVRLGVKNVEYGILGTLCHLLKLIVLFIITLYFHISGMPV